MPCTSLWGQHWGLNELREERVLSQGSWLGQSLGRSQIWTPQASPFPPPHAVSPSVTFCSEGTKKAGRQVGRKCGLSESLSSSQAWDKSPTEKNRQALLRTVSYSCFHSTPAGRGGLPALIPWLFSF